MQSILDLVHQQYHALEIHAWLYWGIDDIRPYLLTVGILGVIYLFFWRKRP